MNDVLQHSQEAASVWASARNSTLNDTLVRFWLRWLRLRAPRTFSINHLQLISCICNSMLAHMCSHAISQLGALYVIA